MDYLQKEDPEATLKGGWQISSVAASPKGASVARPGRDSSPRRPVSGRWPVIFIDIVRKQSTLKVLFDFERFDDPNVDTHLSDIMIAMKAECIWLLQPFENKIKADGGLVLVSFGPGRIAIQYHYSSDKATFKKVQFALETYDWKAVIERYARLGQN